MGDLMLDIVRSGGDPSADLESDDVCFRGLLRFESSLWSLMRIERRVGAGSSDDMSGLECACPGSIPWCLLDRLRSGSDSEVVEDNDSAEGERFNFAGGMPRRVCFFSNSASLADDSPMV